MHDRWPRILLLSLSFCVPCAVSAKDKSQVPPAVREGFQRDFPDAKGVKYARETRDGLTRYEANFKKDGKEIEAVYEADGTLVQTEQEIALRELPELIVRSIKQQHPDARLSEAEQVLDPKGTTLGYEVEISVGKDWFELDLDSDGKILKTESDD